MLRLLEIFLVKNSSPFFSKLVRVRDPIHYIFLIGTIKPYIICYWHFLLRSFLSEIFNDPFHQTKKGETNKTVLFWVRDLRSIIDNCFCKRELLEVWQPLWTYPKTSITWNEWSDFDVAQDDDDVPIPEVDDEFAIIPPIPGGPPGPPPPPPTRKLLPPPLTPLAPTKPLLEEWGRLGWGWTWCWKGN